MFLREKNKFELEGYCTFKKEVKWHGNITYPYLAIQGRVVARNFGQQIHLGMLDLFEVIYLFLIFNPRTESCNKILYQYLSVSFPFYTKWIKKRKRHTGNVARLRFQSFDIRILLYVYVTSLLQWYVEISHYYKRYLPHIIKMIFCTCFFMLSVSFQ